MFSKREMQLMQQQGMKAQPKQGESSGNLGDRIADHIDALNEEMPDQLYVNADEYYKNPAKYDTKLGENMPTNLMELIKAYKNGDQIDAVAAATGRAVPAQEWPEAPERTKRLRRGFSKPETVVKPPQSLMQVPAPTPADPNPEVVIGDTHVPPSNQESQMSVVDEMLNMPQAQVTLDEQLAALERQADELGTFAASQESKRETEPTPQTMEEYIRLRAYEILRENGVADPAGAMVKLREKFGNKLKLSLFGDRVFIYTYLPRGQYRRIMDLQRTLAEKERTNDELEENFKRSVIMAALVFPRLSTPDAQESFFLTCEAGLPDSLFTAIQQASKFYSPQEVANLTISV